MRHIERIVLKNYKSLADVDLPMRRLNVLIGQNGSGKSNFLSFFHLLREGADGGLRPAVNDMGGFSQMVYYGHSNSSVEWNITFSEPDKDDVIYAGEISRGATDSTLNF